MPIRTYLDGHNFDGETIRQMGIAFEMALASLGSTPGCDDPIRTALAQGIIVLAQVGERDPERLCEGALQAVTPAARNSASVQRNDDSRDRRARLINAADCPFAGGA